MTKRQRFPSYLSERIIRGVKIETDIPLPETGAGRRSHVSSLPWAELRIGESFFVPDTSSAKLHNNKQYWQKKLGYTFMVRKVEGGVRVWRSK